MKSRYNLDTIKAAACPPPNYKEPVAKSATLSELCMCMHNLPLKTTGVFSALVYAKGVVNFPHLNNGRLSIVCYRLIVPDSEARNQIARARRGGEVDISALANFQAVK